MESEKENIRNALKFIQKRLRAINDILQDSEDIKDPDIVHIINSSFEAIIKKSKKFINKSLTELTPRNENELSKESESPKPNTKKSQKAVPKK